MSEDSLQWLKWISELQSLAQSGLAYTKNEFDINRFIQLRELAATMAAHCSNSPVSDVKALFSMEKGYATPKVDVRSFVLKDDRILLVKERCDGLWTLPGGWVDVNESPSEAAERETKEESGYDVKAIKLLALWDKLKHDHPPRWPHIYKCIFHCEILSGFPLESLEISDVEFFSLNEIPPLSIHRTTEKQLFRLYKLVEDKNSPTDFD